MAPSVVYTPSEEHAAQFWEKYSSTPVSQPRVPAGFPSQLNSPLAWTRSDIQAQGPELVTQLSKGDVSAVERALALFEEKSLQLSEISAENFPLPAALSNRLKGVSDILYRGVGFHVLHGLEPDRYTPEQNVTLYAGISAHVAPQRGFLDRSCSKVLCHVVNASGETIEATTKTPGFTNGPLSFHTDFCEILALYALDIAPEGGKTLVSSAWHVYNDLAAKRPDVLQILAEDWVLDNFQDYSKYPPVTAPFIHSVEGSDKVIMRFSRYPITGFSARKRNPSLPPVTTAQAEAIDAVQFIANKNAIALPWGKGDIVFINDMAIMHARDSFSEGGVSKKRHLLKFYLRDPKQSWPVSATVKGALNKIYGPNREDGTRDETWCMRWTGDADSWQQNG